MGSSATNGALHPTIGAIELAARHQQAVGVFIVCDVRVYRESLAELLGREDGIRVLGVAARPDDAIATIDTTGSELLLVDVSGPDGASGVRRLVQHWRDAKVLALGLSEHPRDAAACAVAGAIGYIRRGASLAELIGAIKTAATEEAIGSLFGHAALGRPVRRPGSCEARNEPVAKAGSDLTTRELEVLGLIDQGLSNKEIGHALSIEVATVKSHVHSILMKLSLRRRSQVSGWLRAQNGLDAAA